MPGTGSNLREPMTKSSNLPFNHPSCPFLNTPDLENSAPNKVVHSILKQYCQKVNSFISALGVCSVALFLFPDSSSL